MTTPPPPTPQAPPPAEVPASAGTLTHRSIQSYVWARYVEHGTAPFDLDEAEALEFLERHYHAHPLRQDAECFYYGILAYEHSFAAVQPRRSFYLDRAREALGAYRDQTHGFTWEAVEDRYQDAVRLLGSRPA